MFGPHRQHQICQDFTVRIQSGKRRNQRQHSGRSAHHRDAENAWNQEAQKRLKNPADDAAAEIEQKKMVLSNGLLDRPAKHVESYHVPHEMPGTCVEKLKSEQLPEGSIFQVIGSQYAISQHPTSAIARVASLN